ncbi:hypothetical protein SAMN05443999_10920 [Roseovarius azorensis]|uniref:Uncharacterized protein n=1 Tax=Roseovarius azorensis TaxID=1287727 RepID=A0A1H7TR65_9RHOB|nr:hypothetical protein SAMN05443999_10920 [Roseovarius azorensis]
MDGIGGGFIRVHPLGQVMSFDLFHGGNGSPCSRAPAWSLYCQIEQV